MFSIIFTWLIVAWGALACIYMLRCAWSRFPRRDVDADDVIPFLYPVDISLAESILDPAAEFECRWKLGPRRFREAQRKRMRLYLELTRRMAHNARVLVEYADAEKAQPRSSPRQPGFRAARECNRSPPLFPADRNQASFLAAAARGYLEVDAGSRASAHYGRIDGLQTYSALKTAAAAAFIQLPPDEQDSLFRNL